MLQKPWDLEGATSDCVQVSFRSHAETLRWHCWYIVGDIDFVEQGRLRLQVWTATSCISHMRKLGTRNEFSLSLTAKIRASNQALLLYAASSHHEILGDIKMGSSTNLGGWCQHSLCSPKCGTCCPLSSARLYGECVTLTTQSSGS